MGSLSFLFGCKKKQNPPGENPYKYDIGQFRKIDKELILYKEKPSIAVDAEQIRGLAISNDDYLFVIADKKVFIYDSFKNLHHNFSVDETATCLAVGDSKKIYIGVKDHIEIFNQKGEQIDKRAVLSENAQITAIAVNKEHVAVADYGNKQLWLFNKEGKLLRFMGNKRYSEDKQGFVLPSPFFDVDFDKNGDLWANNTGRLRLEQFSIEGVLKSTWGRPSMDIAGFPGCCNPIHFAILPNGDFVTAQKGIILIKLYDHTGRFKGIVAGEDLFQKGATDLKLEVDSQGDIYVIDSIKKRIRVFTLK